MSRNQWIVLAVLGLVVAMIFGCLGAFALLYVTGDFPIDTSGPVQRADTPTPRLTNTPTVPRVSALCQSQTADYLAQLEPVLDEWQDAVEVANSTARIALSPMVRDLQRIQRDVEEVLAPDCGRHGSNLLIGGMDNIIDAFIAFMGDESESVVSYKFSGGYDQMTRGLEELSHLALGQIPPTRTPLPTRASATPTRTRAASAAVPTNTRVIAVSTPVPPTPTRVPATPTPSFLPSGSGMTVNNWEVRVERILTADTMTSPYSGDIYKAAGRWALVFMTVTNRGLRPDTFVAVGQLQVQDAEGRRYDEDCVVSFIAEGIHNTEMAVDINPDASAHIVAAFDISRQSQWYALVPGILADTHSMPVLLSVP